ncbi:MAG: hypothetical protein JXK05_03975 [Campylobacterales bacterium]|nr:hypothetical protein [Campylobacterales bacterium]
MSAAYPIEPVDVLDEVRTMLHFCQIALRGPDLEAEAKDGFHSTLECVLQKVETAKLLILDHLKAS